jgi:hypothetical protein
VDVLGADGSVETITGTTIHPVWSVDRQEWVPLAELADGETLQGLDGLAVVLSVSLSRVSQPVYNIEVHGEHVYQVGGLGVLVHNVGSSIGGVSRVWPKHHPFPMYLGGAADQTLKKIPRNLHYQFHSSLDKWMGGMYARAHTAAAFKNIDKAQVIKDLTKFYKTADGGAYA